MNVNWLMDPLNYSIIKSKIVPNISKSLLKLNHI